jgi:hypothetical protein
MYLKTPNKSNSTTSKVAVFSNLTVILFLAGFG